MIDYFDDIPWWQSDIDPQIQDKAINISISIFRNACLGVLIAKIRNEEWQWVVKDRCWTMVKAETIPLKTFQLGLRYD